MKAAEKNVINLKRFAAREELYAIKEFSKSKGRSIAKDCKNCGKSNHREQDCQHRNVECYRCHRNGHFQAVCKKKTEIRTDETNWMQTEVQSST